MHAGLGGLYQVVLIVNQRGGTSQIVDLIHLHIKREGHIVAHPLEVWVMQQMQDVVFGAGEEVIQADHIVAAVQQALAQMRAEEAGAASDERAGAGGVVFQTIRFLDISESCCGCLKS